MEVLSVSHDKSNRNVWINITMFIPALIVLTRNESDIECQTYPGKEEENTLCLLFFSFVLRMRKT